MDLPVIDTPVFPRWVWIEEITYSHIPIATMITAWLMLAPVFEWIGVAKKDPRYDRLARGLVWFIMILFSPGAALGTGIPVFIIGAYPEFWSRWSNIFFWPLMVQFGFFLMEVGFIFFGYYLSWDALSGRRKWLHIFFGFCAAISGYLVQIVWDATGAYMTTPGPGSFPQVNEPVSWSASAFFNPSFLPLLLHRTFGNFSYTMLLVGGVYALKYMRRKPDNPDKAYYGWSANFTFCLGLVFFFAQPVLGWVFARTYQAHAPLVFAAIMGGHVSIVFIIKMALILFFLAVGSIYVVTRYRASRLLPIVLTLGILVVLVVVLHHPPLKWIGGSPGAWYATVVIVLGGLIALMWLLRGRFNPDARGWQWALFAAGLASFFVFAFGGFVRERGRNPDTVVGHIQKPEITEYELNRYTMYTTCLGCHENSPSFLSRYAERADKLDWEQVVRRELKREGAPSVSDEQAGRIVQHLREAY